MSQPTRPWAVQVEQVYDASTEIRAEESRARVAAWEAEMARLDPARRLIVAVATALGRDVPMNSGWHVELPVKVQELLDQRGYAAARRHLSQCFAEGTSRPRHGSVSR